jgi:hypothetical protein
MLDEQWIPAVAARDLAVITRDRHLRTRPRELAMLRQHKLRVYCLTGRRDMSVWDQLCLVVATWPAIEHQLATAGPGPWFATVTGAGLRPLPT